MDNVSTISLESKNIQPGGKPFLIAATETVKNQDSDYCNYSIIKTISNIKKTW